MRIAMIAIVVGGLTAAGAVVAAGVAAPQAAPENASGLRSVSSFQSIKDPAARSLALFEEAGKVIQSPRCLNCHPVERAPTQGDDLRPHYPPMVAGDSGHGPASLPCLSCHTAANVPAWGDLYKSIPGDPKWALAPAEMAWQGNLSGHFIFPRVSAFAENETGCVPLTTHGFIAK